MKFTELAPLYLHIGTFMTLYVTTLSGSEYLQTNVYTTEKIDIIFLLSLLS